MDADKKYWTHMTFLCFCLHLAWRRKRRSSQMSKMWLCSLLNAMLNDLVQIQRILQLLVILYIDSVQIHYINNTKLKAFAPVLCEISWIFVKTNLKWEKLVSPQAGLCLPMLVTFYIDIITSHCLDNPHGMMGLRFVQNWWDFVKRKVREKAQVQ